MSAFDEMMAARNTATPLEVKATFAHIQRMATVLDQTLDTDLSAFAVAASAPAPPRLVKLARSSMRSYVHRLHKEQGGLCPLCSHPIDLSIKGEGVLDHDHDTGHIRGVLHRSCNAAEGKISNAAARWGAKSSSYADIIPYLENLVRYLKATPTNMIYPMHKTPDEKRDARALAAKVKRADLKAKRELALRKRQGKE